MATKVECKTCSKCLWEGLGEGAPNCLSSPSQELLVTSQCKPVRGVGQGQRGGRENSPENVIYRCTYMCIYISIYM